MKKSAITPEAAFNKAMDWFFGHNPKIPYWILVALYLRHEHKLHVVKNYAGDKSCIIAPVFDIDYAAITVRQTDFEEHWASGEYTNICVVGDIADDTRIQQILQTFKSNSIRSDNTLGIFGLRQWEASFLIETAQMLLDIDDDWFDSNFSTLFERTISRSFSKERVEMYAQPKEVSMLVGALLGEVNGNVYNPYAGLGSYGLYLKGKFEYVGEEVLPLTAAIGNIRLIANHINGKIHIKDSTRFDDRKFAAVVSTPPFGMNVSDSHERYGDLYSHETLLLHRLSDIDARSIVVCRASISCSGGPERRLRREIVEKGCVDSVILLPSNIFSMTGIATVIFVIDKNHNHQGYIRLIDASKCFTGDRRKAVVNVDEILNLCNETSSKSVLAEIDKIVSKDYSLNPAYYMPVQMPDRAGECIKLSQIGTFESLHASAVEKEGLFANFIKLGSSNKAKIYTSDDFELAELPRSAVKFTEQCVLISGARGLRAVCVDPKGTTLYGHSSYKSFKCDTTKVNPQYLALQLSEDYVQDQVGAKDSLSVSAEALNNIQILLPSLQEQEQYVAEYQNRLIGELGIEIQNSRIREFEDFEKNMRIRRHSLGNKLQSIMPAAQLLCEFLARQTEPFSKDIVVGKRSGYTLLGMMERLYANLQQVEDLIDKFTEVDEFGKDEIIDLDQFCVEYANNAIKDGYELLFSSFSIVGNIDGIGNLESPDLLVRFSRKDLQYVFENIITNAKKHGFTNPQRDDYNIHVKAGNFLDSDGVEKVYIRFFNNGDHLPSGMNPEKVFNWGEGKGSGLGGWHIKRIVEHFGGTVSVRDIEDSDDGYTVEYEIIVPLINSEE